MTKRELLHELSRMPMDAPVYIRDDALGFIPIRRADYIDGDFDYADIWPDLSKAFVTTPHKDSPSRV